jgi:hypothetical protein
VYNSKQYSRNYANELDHPPVDNIFHKYEKTKKSGLSHDKSSIEKAGLSIQDE